MAGFLISYKDTEDPNFNEFTYGSAYEGRRLLTLKKGDVLFFHIKQFRKRCITAFYVVEKVLTVKEAKENRYINGFYQNHHLYNENSEPNEAIVFGNPIFSKVLDIPLELTHEFLNKLSKKPNFNQRQDYQDAMTSALRTMKELSNLDVELIMAEIEKVHERSRLTDTLLLTEEVQQIKESDIEKFLIQNHKYLSHDAEIVDSQYTLANGRIIDILLKHPLKESYTVVEIKKGDIGRKELDQIRDYIQQLKKEKEIEAVKGILVCKGIMPYFREEIEKITKQNDIKILSYAWKFSLKEHSI